jgi:iron complex transport system ATP-binding protein
MTAGTVAPVWPRGVPQAIPARRLEMIQAASTRRDDGAAAAREHRRMELPTIADPIVPRVTVGAGSSVVSLRDLSVRGDDGQPLLSDISLSIGSGEHWAVLGRNGSGKTTLLNVVRGVVAPTHGDVIVLGERHGEFGFRDPRLRLGFVESPPPTFAAHLSAVELVVLRAAGPAALRGSQLDPDEVQQARALLRFLRCGHVCERPYGVCSRGEQQRINLARALLREPDVLLLDEPTAGLDLAGRVAFLQSMERLAALRPRLSSISVSHHVEELPASTTHAALMLDGALLVAGPALDVLTDAALSRAFGVAVAVHRSAGGWGVRVIDDAASPTYSP